MVQSSSICLEQAQAETDGLVASPERENARPDVSGSERQSPRNGATEEHVHEFVHTHPLTNGGLPQEHTHLATMSSAGSGLASNIQDLSSSTSVDIADAVPEILPSGYQTTTKNTPISQGAPEVVDEEQAPVIFNAQLEGTPSPPSGAFYSGVAR